MSQPAKLTLFALLFTFSAMLLSCDKEKYDIIPDVYVNFTIDLLDPEFTNLNAIGNFVYISSSTNNWGQSAAGYGGNGIIVYSSLPDSFAAYDRTCPHDFAATGSSIRVNVDFTLAVCDECGTTYALSANGTPASGIGRYPLKNYQTSFDGRYIHVWNNR